MYLYPHQYLSLYIYIYPLLKDTFKGHVGFSRKSPGTLNPGGSSAHLETATGQAAARRLGRRGAVDPDCWTSQGPRANPKETKRDIHITADVHMHVCVYIYIYVCVYICICKYVDKYIRMCVCVYLHIYIHVYVMYIHIYVYIYIPSTHTYCAYTDVHRHT